MAISFGVRQLISSGSVPRRVRGKRQFDLALDLRNSLTVNGNAAIRVGSLEVVVTTAGDAIALSIASLTRLHRGGIQTCR